MQVGPYMMHINLNEVERAKLPTAIQVATDAVQPEVSIAATGVRQDEFVSPYFHKSTETGEYTRNAWEWDNSADTTIDRLWQSEAGFWGNDATKGMSREEYIAYRQQNAGGSVIDWDTLTSQLSMPSQLRLQTASDGDIASGIERARNRIREDTDVISYDYFAAQYASLHTAISSSYTGEEQIAQLERLDNLFMQTVTRYADTHAAVFDEKLSQYGITDQKETIKQSYLALFDDLKASYLEYAFHNPDYTGVKGTENEWLTDDVNFMANSLRAVCPAFDEVKSQVGELYSARELSALAVMLDEMQIDIRSCGHGSEEELGVKIGETALKIKEAGNYAGSKLSALSSRLIEGFANKAIDFADENIKWLREDAERRKNDPRSPVVDHSQDAFLNRQIIMKILETVLNASDNGKSTKDAISIGVHEAKESFKKSQAENPGYLRYGAIQDSSMAGYLRHYFNIDKSDSTYMAIRPFTNAEEAALKYDSFMQRLQKI